MSARLAVAALLATLSAALLAAFWISLRPSEARDGEAARALEALQRQLAALQTELAQERSARRILASEVELLREVVLEFGEELTLGAEYGELGGVPDTADVAGAASPGAQGAEESNTDDPLAGESAKEREAADPVFDIEQLTAAGIDQSEAERVRDIWNRIELEKLELRDQALREGWMSSKRYRRQLDRITRDAVSELGECGYDSMLYGSGKKNRVVVRDVIEGSTAANSGIHSGDVILRYNDKRIWAGSDLQSATSRGERGETVSVDILRDGAPLYIRVERGPLGMFMSPQRVPPDGC